MKPVTTTIS